MMEYTFKVAGQAMAALKQSDLGKYHSPGAHDAQEALRTATSYTAGHGRTYIVTTTRAGAECLLEYCQRVGVELANVYGHPETRSEGRALLNAAYRIERALEGR